MNPRITMMLEAEPPGVTINTAARMTSTNPHNGSALSADYATRMTAQNVSWAEQMDFEEGTSASTHATPPQSNTPDGTPII